MSKKTLFDKVAIIGVGLIGGSLGLAIKKRKLARRVVGLVRKKKTLQQALRKKVVHEATLDFEKAICNADLVILASPIPAILKQLRRIEKNARKGTLVIDVGSSKIAITKASRSLKRIQFVGCHPMAGAAQSGLNNSSVSADLFEGACCFGDS